MSVGQFCSGPEVRLLEGMWRNLHTEEGVEEF